MTRSKIVALGLITSLVLAIVGAMTEGSQTNALAQNFYMFSGLGFLVFGTWGAVELWGAK